MRLLTAMTVAMAMLLVCGGQLGAQWLRPDLQPMPTPEQVGQTFVERDGQVYGAVPGELGPIGGGGGYGGRDGGFSRDREGGFGRDRDGGFSRDRDGGGGRDRGGRGGRNRRY